MIETRKV